MLSNSIMTRGIKSITTQLLSEITPAKPIIDHLGIGKLIDKYATMRETDLPHGRVIETVILNRLSSPTPFYRIEDWAAGYGIREVYGIPAERKG